MNLKRIALADIHRAPYNPRVPLKPGDPDYEKLKRSILRFECVEPLVVNKRTGNLIAGHQRLSVLIELGHTEVDAVVIDLPPNMRKR